MLRASFGSTSVVLTRFLRRFGLFFAVLWLWYAFARFTFPFLLTVNFLLAVLFVFIFGIKTLTTPTRNYTDPKLHRPVTNTGPLTYTFPVPISRGALPKAGIIMRHGCEYFTHHLFPRRKESLPLL